MSMKDINVYEIHYMMLSRFIDLMDIKQKMKYL